MRPVSVFKGDRVTLHVDGEPLTKGEHSLEVELFEINLGRLSFWITDRHRLSVARPPARVTQPIPRW